ncbi:hypothetical protein EDC04DRAFT_2606943 [Pisolithus marmoratus]|nr:hypothetical protein EDC04DRAFT_2606943 [Pisolithus marmoratus]
MSHAYFPKDVPSVDILNKLLATERLVQGSAVTRCVMKDSQKAAAKNLQWQSEAFDSYLRIEYWVMHHEPWLVREFRHSNDLNINQCKVFYDLIVAEDTDFGYTFKEHLPVEDPDQEEGQDQEGWEQDDAMSQEV